MLFWKITLISIREIRALVEDLKDEKSAKDKDSPGELTGEEIAFVVTERLLQLVPKIIGIVKSK